MLHALKTWPKYFEEIISGIKTFEVRKFDRPFEESDDIVLQEYDPGEKMYTGKEWHGRISYIMADPEFCKKGYCILGIKEKSETQPPKNNQ